MSEQKVVIYTDGGCRGNPGPGGWGAVIQFADQEKEIYGYDPETTNNRMELMAAISALELLKSYISLKEEISVIDERKTLLEKELKEVSIRVNLFEKVLIPRSIQTIKKIKIFLGDQQLAAVSQGFVRKFIENFYALCFKID